MRNLSRYQKRPDRPNRKGVSWEGFRGCWVAHIGRNTRLGYFEFYEDACNAREKAEKERGYLHQDGRKTPPKDLKVSKATQRLLASMFSEVDKMRVQRENYDYS